MSATVPGLPEPRAAEALRAGGADAHSRWPAVLDVKLRLSARLPLFKVTLQDVQRMTAGVTIGSDWPADAEVPLLIAGSPLGWCEFEASTEAMTLRLTRLA